MGADPQNKAKRRVLVVEDDPDLSSLLRTFLQARGFSVMCFANGVEALRAIIGTEFEVIVCDLMMPRMAGDMFYDAVRRVKPQLCERFIFITGHAESPRVKEFLANVSETVLKKPFHLDDLAAIIRALLDDLEHPDRRLDAHLPAPGDHTGSAGPGESPAHGASDLELAG